MKLLGIDVISPLISPWADQLALAKRAKFNVGKVQVAPQFATAPENVAQLLDVLVPDPNGRKAIIYRTDDAKFSAADIRKQFIDGGFDAFVRAHPEVDAYIEVGNEPDHAGVNAQQQAAMLRDALKLRPHVAPGLSWLASMPTNAAALDTVLPATVGYEGLATHWYSWTNPATDDGGGDWQKILDRLIALDRAIWITELGIDDKATAPLIKAQRILAWLETLPARVVGGCLFTLGTHTQWPQYELTPTAADFYGQRSTISAPAPQPTGNTGKETHVPAIRQGVDRAGGIAVWEAQGLKSLGFDWCGVYIGGPTNGGYGWSRKVVDALGQQVGWRFMPIYVGQNTDWTPVSKLSQAQGVIDGKQAAQLMQQFGWLPGKNLVVALDVEYNTNEQHLSKAVEYMVSWCNTVTREGYLPAIYSHAFALNAYAAVAQVPTYAWLTAWISTHKLDNLDLKHGLTAQFAGYAIQYTGGTWLQGQSTDFDLNAATDTFPLNPAPAEVGDIAQEQTVTTSVHFDETGHGIGGGIFQYWSHYGGLKIFGFPLTDEFDITDKGDDGKPVKRTVQVFERAVFERHPGEAPDDWDIMLRRVGAEAQPAIEAMKAS